MIVRFSFVAKTSLRPGRYIGLDSQMLNTRHSGFSIHPVWGRRERTWGDCAYRKSHTRPEPPAQTDEGWAHSSLKRQEAREISERDLRTEKKFVAVVAASISTRLSLDRNCIEERRLQAARRS